MIGVRRTTNTCVGGKHQGEWTYAASRKGNQLSGSSSTDLRGNPGAALEAKTNPTSLSQILEPNKIEGFIPITRLPHPQNTCRHLKQQLTLPCLVLLQQRRGSPSRRWMTASPFLGSTCVYCKKKYKILHARALPVGLSTRCLYFHLCCEATLLKNLFFRCHSR